MLCDEYPYVRWQEQFEQCRWLFSCANHNSLCLQVSGTKVLVKRWTSRMPNLRLMSKIYYYRLLPLGSTHVKFDVWRGTEKLQIIRPRATTNSWKIVLAFLRNGDFVWYLREFALNVIIISSFCCLRLCCWRLKMANGSPNSRKTGTHPSWNHEKITSRSNCKNMFIFS